jgi:hypothetical protein
MPTHSLGLVEIGKNQFFMSVDSVRIESLMMTAAGRVELKGTARSITRVGDKFEEAIVPFNAVAVDGGPGFERDSLLLTVFYNAKIPPCSLPFLVPRAISGTPSFPATSPSRGSSAHFDQVWSQRSLFISREQRATPQPSP